MAPETQILSNGACQLLPIGVGYVQLTWPVFDTPVAVDRAAVIGGVREDRIALAFFAGGQGVCQPSRLFLSHRPYLMTIREMHHQRVASTVQGLRYGKLELRGQMQ